MKRFLILAAMMLLFINANAAGNSSAAVPDSLMMSGQGVFESEMIEPVTPVYHRTVMVRKPWTANWFVSAAGGASAGGLRYVSGADIDSKDFWRISPMAFVSLGKWFTPSAGVRMQYNANGFKEAGTLHLDMMWNVFGGLYSSNGLTRWTLSPIVGAGVDLQKGSPFILAAGLHTQYRFTKRWAISMEVSDLMKFPGSGSVHQPSVSAGLTFSLGRVGWKRVVNAEPYMRQNEWLIVRNGQLTSANEELASARQKHERIIAQLRKILEIEGLLDKYSLEWPSPDDSASDYPHNDYSGLNSLNERLRNRSWDGRSDLYAKATATDPAKISEESMTVLDSLDADNQVGAQIFFFFERGSSRLTDRYQSLNLDEIARVVLKHGLSVTVIGAADSATGSDKLNQRLSSDRSDFIAAELLSRGVSSDKINKASEGGISRFQPTEANRHTRIVLCE